MKARTFTKGFEFFWSFMPWCLLTNWCLVNLTWIYTMGAHKVDDESYFQLINLKSILFCQIAGQKIPNIRHFKQVCLTSCSKFCLLSSLQISFQNPFPLKFTKILFFQLILFLIIFLNSFLSNSNYKWKNIEKFTRWKVS